MSIIVFLDRDGVINHDSPDYIKSPEEFHFINGSPEAVALLNAHGFEVILITNQSMIGRGMVPQSNLDAIFEKMHAGIAAAGGEIKDIFYCPHTPDAGCHCRKPQPGMIRDACARHGIDPARSVMVGDSTKDMGCGRNAGCDAVALVATGNGEKSLAEMIRQGCPPEITGADLMDVARQLINRYPG